MDCWTGVLKPIDTYVPAQVTAKLQYLSASQPLPKPLLHVPFCFNFEEYIYIYKSLNCLHLFDTQLPAANAIFFQR